MAASNLKRMIPHDLVGEILQCFPPKSLARFQCVSKKWRSMILEQISNRNSKEEKEKVLLISASSIQSIDFTEPEIKAVTLLQFSVKDNFYLGSVNGLVLYLDRENRALILFNPWTQTRQPINIPHLNPKTPDYYAYGFGYDKSNGNYVIVIIDRQNRNGFTWSSKTQNWVPFSSLLDPVIWNSTYYGKMSLGLCVNGSIYWEIDSGVLCFDLKTCNFDVIEEPSSGGFRHLELFVLGDRLAAVEFIFDCSVESRRTYVWELDGQMQWIKIMTIPRFILSPEDAVEYQSVYKVNGAVFHELLAPVLRLKNGDLILVSRIFGWNGKNAGPMTDRGPTRGKFYLYNEERETFTMLKTTGPRGIKHFDQMFPYKYNLFSPVLKEDGMGDINFKFWS